MRFKLAGKDQSNKMATFTFTRCCIFHVADRKPVKKEDQSALEPASEPVLEPVEEPVVESAAAEHDNSEVSICICYEMRGKLKTKKYQEK